mmetsp:Transcript_48230/g.134045  ORF Transcript_48230/g.134045 Transcript_48230/m.134045 type:complete len:483 (+) Transcript_48230:732-2180(+)
MHQLHEHIPVKAPEVPDAIAYLVCPGLNCNLALQAHGEHLQHLVLVSLPVHGESLMQVPPRAPLQRPLYPSRVHEQVQVIHPLAELRLVGIQVGDHVDNDGQDPGPSHPCQHHEERRVNHLCLVLCVNITIPHASQGHDAVVHGQEVRVQCAAVGGPPPALEVRRQPGPPPAVLGADDAHEAPRAGHPVQQHSRDHKAREHAHKGVGKADLVLPVYEVLQEAYQAEHPENPTEADDTQRLRRLELPDPGPRENRQCVWPEPPSCEAFRKGECHVVSSNIERPHFIVAVRCAVAGGEGQLEVQTDVQEEKHVNNQIHDHDGYRGVLFIECSLERQKHPDNDERADDTEVPHVHEAIVIRHDRELPLLPALSELPQALGHPHHGGRCRRPRGHGGCGGFGRHRHHRLLLLLRESGVEPAALSEPSCSHFGRTVATPGGQWLWLRSLLKQVLWQWRVGAPGRWHEQHWLGGPHRRHAVLCSLHGP